MTKVQLRGLAMYVKGIAKEKGTSAAMNGAWNDGGERDLLNEVDAFLCGMEGVVPANWNDWAKEHARINDVEYAEYLRLQKKFA